MTPRINFVTLGVTDVMRATGFYERLGLKKSTAGDENVSFFDVNGVVLALFAADALADDANMEGAPLPKFRGMSLAWNASSEAEADEIFAHALACGATPVKALEKIFWGGYSGYFADPDGHLWEVAFNPFMPLSEQGRIQLP
jgi:predicted lactoylglutathione lyase